MYRARALSRAAFTIALSVAALVVPPVAANAEVVWLCRPGDDKPYCRGSLETTVYSPSGSAQIRTPDRPKKSSVDCFYVYPTVSEQPTPAANKDIDPEIKSIAKYQAARFSQICRVFAPVYRQITLSGLFNGASEADRERAYNDVKVAWRSYLRNHNNGRGVIMIGHSQGASLLRRLVAEKVDSTPRIRSRMLSAILLGSSVAVPKGEVVGGTFKNVPGCTKKRQTSCVISYATFGTTPPDDSFFGTLRSTSDLPPDRDYEALCTNPAALGGGRASLRFLTPSRPFTGVFAAIASFMYSGDVPSAPTPWLRPQDRYTGECVTANNAHVLMTYPVGDAAPLQAAPTPQWGLHLLDANLPLGNLIELAKAQKKTHARR